MEVQESDWKLFRKKIIEWQEQHMENLNREYIELLSGPGEASDKFWKLDKRIRRDKRSVGVIVDMRRSQMHFNLVALLEEEIIGLEDLRGFSQELIEQVAFMSGQYGNLTKVFPEFGKKQE